MSELRGLSEAWTEWLLMASIQAVVFILFVLGACWLIRKSSQCARCWLWRLAFLKLVLLLIFVSPFKIPILPHIASEPIAATDHQSGDLQKATNPFASTEGDSQVLDVPAAKAVSSSVILPMSESLKAVIPGESAAVSSATKSKSLDIHSILLGLWLTGVAVGIGFVLRAFQSNSAFRRQLTPIKDPRYISLLAQLGSQFKVARTPALAISDLTQSPCLMGLFDQVIVIPKHLAENLDDERIAMILAHELAHKKRRDLWWVWLPTIARTAFFFNPLVWVALKKWNVAREMACDELVLKVTNFSPASYAEVLVNIASQTTGTRLLVSPASISMVQSSSLKRRLLAMSHFTQSSRISARSISLILFVSLTAIVGLIPWQPVEKQAFAEAPVSWSLRDEVAQDKPIRNLNFEKIDKEGSPLYFGGGGLGYTITVDDDEPYRGKYSGKLTFVGDDKPQFGACNRRIDAKRFHGKRIAFRGYLKTDLKADGAAGLWIRVDEGAKSVGFDNMMDRPVEGKTDWKQYHIVLDVPKTADYITFGFLLSGAGECWCDDLTLEVEGDAKEAGEETKAKDAEKAFAAAMMKRAAGKRWKSPRNLDFETTGKDNKPEFFSNRSELAASIDTKIFHGGKQSCRIGSEDKKGVGTCVGAVSTANYVGKRIELRGFIKTNFDNDSRAGIWMRVDEGMKSVSFDNMMERAVTGKSDWQECTLVMDVPKSATGITFGLMVIGSGNAWFDDLSLSVVGELGEGPDVTGYRNAGEVLRLSNSGVKSKILGRESLNLDFELQNGGAAEGWACGGPGYAASLDSEVKAKGKLSAKLEKTGDGQFGGFSRSISPDSFRGKKVVFTGKIKVSNNTKGGAGLWMRVNGKNHNTLAFDNMDDRLVSGDSEWEDCKIELEVGEDATEIRFGYLLQGNGTSWGDDFKLEVKD